MPFKYPFIAAAGKGIGAGLMAAYGRYRYRNTGQRAKRNYQTRFRNRTGKYAMFQRRPTWRGWDTAVRGKLMPPAQFKTFTWIMDDNLQTSLTQGIIGAENDYALNDIFAPSRTSVTVGANHNAYGHDQMTTFYNKYMVYRVRLTLTVYTDDTANVIACVSHIGPPGDNQAISGKPPYQVEEWPGTEVVRIAPAGEHKWEITREFSIPSISGGSKGFDETTFSANFGASPTNYPVFRVGFANMTLPTAVTMRYTLKIEFFTKVYDRRTLAISS